MRWWRLQTCRYNVQSSICDVLITYNLNTRDCTSHTLLNLTEAPAISGHSHSSSGGSSKRARLDPPAGKSTRLYVYQLNNANINKVSVFALYFNKTETWTMYINIYISLFPKCYTAIVNVNQKHPLHLVC